MDLSKNNTAQLCLILWESSYIEIFPFLLRDIYKFSNRKWVLATYALFEIC